DEVERLVQDPAVKGIWCVPMYSNPDGITYADETVRRFARLQPAAPDFRIMWDNAYCVHHLNDTPDTLLNLYKEAEAVGNEDIVIQFTSTSKISFPGAGVAALAASPANIADIKARMTIQTIGHDKINMLRHTRYFKNLDGVREHMKRHAAVLRPKFDVVLNTLDTRLGNKDIARWHKPNGGYFVSVELMEGTAAETVRLLKSAGVVLTPAGATYPYGKDPKDATLRIAPSYPSLAELQTAMDLFCICAEIAALNKLLA
ncbi:MAG: aminotransferase, partial [Clostridia bacterium]|nr:aminotransferase [Clostridia bacterium]